jgi:Protein of unknown function (DUF1559)
MRRPGISRFGALVALVACLFVVGVGVMLLTRHRETALRAQCENNLRLIGIAVRAYHGNADDPKARLNLPPSYLADRYASWAPIIAPHLVNDSPLIRWDLEQSYFTQPTDVREARLIMFFCPARRRLDTLSAAGDVDGGKHFPGGLGDYGAVAGDNDVDWTGPKADGAMIVADVLERKDDRLAKWQSRTSLKSLTRGEQYTMLVGEKHVLPEHMGDAAFGDGSLYNGQNPVSFSRIAGPGFPLASSMDAPYNRNFGSWHNGVCIFLMADSSRRVLANNTSEFVLGELARREK